MWLPYNGTPGKNVMSSLLNCSRDCSENRVGIHPSRPFCLTWLSMSDTFSDVLGMMKGEHVGWGRHQVNHRATTAS